MDYYTLSSIVTCEQILPPNKFTFHEYQGYVPYLL